MNTSRFKVLWVYQLVKVQAGLKLEAGQKPSLCFKGRKHMFCVSAGHPVRVLKRDVKDFDKLRMVRKGGADYPVEDAVIKFREIAERCGITQGADAILVRAENHALDIGDIEESLANEEDEIMETPSPATPADSTTTETKKETTVSKKTAKKSVKAKAPKKAAKAKTPKGPSRISKAVEYMREEVKKEGGQKNLERGWRKELFERAAKKFDLSPTTCSIQYNKQVLNK